MKITKIILLATLSLTLFTLSDFAVCKDNRPGQTNSSYLFNNISPLSAEEQQSVRKYSWHSGCPVGVDKLASVKINYFGFDNKTHLGTLIVNKQLAPEVSKIFATLYQQKFPIQKIIPSDYYHGDDDKIMADNDTSAFLCRDMTEHPHVLSKHSYGIAIDINPLINPTIMHNVVLPPAGKAYLERTKLTKGMIVKNSAIYNIFKKYGWSWGGDWKNLKDYQHFEKR